MASELGAITYLPDAALAARGKLSVTSTSRRVSMDRASILKRREQLGLPTVIDCNAIVDSVSRSEGKYQGRAREVGDEMQDECYDMTRIPVVM